MRKKRKQKIPRRATVIPDSPDTKRLLDSLPRIYAIGCWARYGVREYYYSGKDVKGIPMVWDYNDHNGTEPEWVLLPLHYTTMGLILAWTTSRGAAEKIAEALNAEARHDS